MLDRHLPRAIAALALITILLTLTGCTAGQSTGQEQANLGSPTPHGTDTPNASPTPSPSSTPQPTATETPLPTATATKTPTLTPTPTPTLIGGYPGQYIEPVRGYDNTQVNIYDANGTLVKTIFEYSFNPDDRYSDYFEGFKVSPSGDTFAFGFGLDGANPLVLMRPDGTQIITLERNTNFYGGYIGQYNWSPDGQWLVFASSGDNYYADIYMIDKNGENLQQLTNTYARNSSPLFSPQGDRIYYFEDTTWMVLELGGESRFSNLYPIDSMTRDGRYYLYADTPKRAGLGDLETGENKNIFITHDPDFYISRIKFSPDDQWVLISEYDATGETIPRGCYRWYKLSMAALDQPELFATARNLVLTPDGSLVVLMGWLPTESMGAEPKYYAIDLAGTTVIPLSAQASSFLRGTWLPGSTATTNFDPSAFRGPTPVPAWEPLPEAPIYDAFEGRALDPNRWQPSQDQTSDVFHWEVWDGDFNIRSEASALWHEVSFFLNADNPIQKLTSFGSRVRLWGGTWGSAELRLDLRATINGHDWLARCSLGMLDDEPVYTCHVRSYFDDLEQTEYSTLSIPAELNTWYEARIELSPELGALQFYFNGERIGTYQPRQYQALIDGIQLRPTIGVWTLDSAINASFDDVRISR